VSGRRPSWDRKDAAEFGFEFPLPTKNWRVMTRSMVIRNREHPMMAGLASSYDYEVSDWNGTTVAGLTRAGGEYFVQSHSDAETLATLDDTHLVGIGVYRNLVVLSPTYWPSFGFYQYDRHPEVIELLRRAVRVDMTTRQSGTITTAS
jgi:hypothetical protein